LVQKQTFLFLFLISTVLQVGAECKADDDLALKNNIIVAKSKEVETGSVLTESSKEVFGLKSAVLLMVVMNTSSVSFVTLM
jgi:hypothetical protein